jgi:DNA-binding transcriptional ArsR family regulator
MAATDVDTRFKIFEALVKSHRMLTLSEISKRLKMDQQRVSYHLPLLERSGLIIRDGYHYFPQPIFLDKRLEALCDEKLSEIVEGFSALDIPLVVGEDQTKEEIIVSCLYALIRMVLPDHVHPPRP